MRTGNRMSGQHSLTDHSYIQGITKEKQENWYHTLHAKRTMIGNGVIGIEKLCEMRTGKEDDEDDRDKEKWRFVNTSICKDNQ